MWKSSQQLSKHKGVAQGRGHPPLLSSCSGGDPSKGQVMTISGLFEVEPLQKQQSDDWQRHQPLPPSLLACPPAPAPSPLPQSGQPGPGPQGLAFTCSLITGRVRSLQAEFMTSPLLGPPMGSITFAPNKGLC